MFGIEKCNILHVGNVRIIRVQHITCNVCKSRVQYITGRYIRVQYITCGCCL